MDYVDRLKSLSHQVESDVSGVTMDDGVKVTVKCSCGQRNEIGARSLIRRWAHKGQYLCKSCSVKTYVNDPNRIKRAVQSFKESMTDERKKKMSDGVCNAWKNDDYREKISKATTRDNITNPLKKIAREKALKALLVKRPNHMAEIRQLNQKTSKIQKMLYEMLDELGVQHFKDDSNECRIGYFVFDCRIDPHDRVKLRKSLLIEVQGDYWHSLPRVACKDASKSTYISRYFDQFDLKYIWEHEFYSKGRVMSLLRHWLGIDEFNQINFEFNDILMKEISIDDAENFISKFHYAGKLGRGGTKFGCYLNDKLIAVCVFSQLLRKETAELQGHKQNEMLELSRFCIHPSYQKKNFASWFISRATKKIIEIRPEIKRLVSFSDSTYNHVGTIYKASNWMFDGLVKPSYWYVDKDGYVAHKKSIWDHASKMNMSESEYCIKFGFVKVCGKEKNRYIYVIKP
jgi:hypothetical protein